MNYAHSELISVRNYFSSSLRTVSLPFSNAEPNKLEIASFFFHSLSRCSLYTRSNVFLVQFTAISVFRSIGFDQL